MDNDLKGLVIIAIAIVLCIFLMASCEVKSQKENAITERQGISAGYTQKQNIAGNMEWVKNEQECKANE